MINIGFFKMGLTSGVSANEISKSTIFESYDSAIINAVPSGHFDSGG